VKPTWRIFYDDGSTFSSLDGEPHEAPARGFICALGYDERGKRYIMHGWDHYYFDDEANQFWGCEIHGLIDRLCMRRIGLAYFLGRTVTRSQWDEFMTLADKDPDFPREGRP
tara:strand:+ start:18895 stop:19230 length:336 start_codon:yes stop_codon:yes gene_type:complete